MGHPLTTLFHRATTISYERFLRDLVRPKKKNVVGGVAHYLSIVSYLRTSTTSIIIGRSPVLDGSSSYGRNIVRCSLLVVKI
jgi:hypothetical protein